MSIGIKITSKQSVDIGIPKKMHPIAFGSTKLTMQILHNLFFRMYVGKNF
ncbi:MAG: hypothetical protein UZ08_BCD001000435 [Candidatus Parvibacillus calidus]|jgi:hypothetical protein|nr:MAG: hypothetical protein UZ08_BCD001000435 [Candidatus Parvibacillus calidus]